MEILNFKSGDNIEDLSLAVIDNTIHELLRISYSQWCFKGDFKFHLGFEHWKIANIYFCPIGVYHLQHNNK